MSDQRNFGAEYPNYPVDYPLDDYDVNYASNRYVPTKNEIHRMQLWNRIRPQGVVPTNRQSENVEDRRGGFLNYLFNALPGLARENISNMYGSTYENLSKLGIGTPHPSSYENIPPNSILPGSPGELNTDRRPHLSYSHNTPNDALPSNARQYQISNSSRGNRQIQQTFPQYFRPSSPSTARLGTFDPLQHMIDAIGQR